MLQDYILRLKFQLEPFSLLKFEKRASQIERFKKLTIKPKTYENIITILCREKIMSALLKAKFVEELYPVQLEDEHIAETAFKTSI